MGPAKTGNEYENCVCIQTQNICMWPSGELYNISLSECRYNNFMHTVRNLKLCVNAETEFLCLNVDSFSDC